jgi:hypothetical protein
MMKDFNPRQAVRGLLQSIAPARPLFLPIVFSLGARIENVSLRNFLTNPTKISNALRQIRTHLRSDGITCYFDPYLEAEALGGVLDWESDARRPSLRWPQPSHDGELPEGLCAPDETAKRGRVPIAVEVIRRLKPLVRDDFLLVAGVTGPLTLAAQIAQIETGESARKLSPPDSALSLAADVTPVVARALVEAGANVILIREELLPPSADALADWSSRLASTINIVRFYEALPVLLLSPARPAANEIENIIREPWDAVVSAPVEAAAGFVTERRVAGYGISLPSSAFEPDQSNNAQLTTNLRKIIPEFHPALVTTTSDLPTTADLKYLNAIAEEVNC